MKLFQINYQRLAALLLPTFLRQPVILSLLNVVVLELEKSRGLYTRFMTKRNENLFYLRYNGQVCLLRAALNEFFGIKNREDGFEIEGAIPLAYWLYAYHEEDTIHESKKILLSREREINEGNTHPVWIYAEKDIEAITTGFTVRYPYEAIKYVEGSNTNENREYYDRMVKLVDTFRLASRTPDYKVKNQSLNN